MEEKEITTTQIELVQKPVIKHQLIKVGEEVTRRIDELNLNNLVATDETIQSLKQLRADLNKEYKEFEDQRKALKEAVAAPYMEFESVYKDEISKKFTDAVSLLKDKIAEFENKVKTEKKKEVEEYFEELCASEKIDFLKFSDTGLNIDLSTSLKKYKEQCAEFVGRVQDDLILINSMDFPAEMMTEYKANGLNASKAISAVNTRKEQEKLEQERIKAEITNKRIQMLMNLAFISHQITRTYVWVQDNSVFIELAEIENLSNADFNKKFAELEQEIKNIKASQVSEQPIVSAPVSAPLSKPVETKQEPEKKEKIVQAKFIAEGTMSQLMALGQYMKENNITYKNI